MTGESGRVSKCGEARTSGGRGSASVPGDVSPELEQLRIRVLGILLGFSIFQHFSALKLRCL